MEAVTKEKLELTKTRNEEKERATYALNKLRDTYDIKAKHRLLLRLSYG